MNDRPKIIVALAAGLVVLTFPFWYAIGWGHSQPSPAVELPEGKTQCVESKEYMLGHHMQLLNQWRQEVVREGDGAPYVSTTFHTKYEKSLTKTCLACHNNRAAFCDRCHNQANVQPTCWDCHGDLSVKEPGKKN